MNLDFRERKAQCAEHYKQCVEGWKEVKCGACNGSGRYDNTGSPPCGCCNGTGKDKDFKPVATSKENEG